MEYFNYFLLDWGALLFFILVAAVSGSLYLHYVADVPKNIHQLVVALWVLFGVMVVNEYSAIAYYSEYRFFGFVKDTLFERSEWLSNISNLWFDAYFAFFFIQELYNQKLKRILKLLLFVFVFGCMTIFVWNGKDHFSSSYEYMFLASSFILVCILLLFLLDLLWYDIEKEVKHHVPFYVSMGMLFFFSIYFPVYFYIKYFKSGNELVIRLSVYQNIAANLFLYGFIVLGFWQSYKAKKQLK